MVGAEECAVGVDGGAADYGVGYVPMELLAFEGAPAALALYAFGGDGPGLATAHDGDVCLVAWAEEAAPTDAEETGWVVSHELHEAFDGEHFLIYEAEHGDE